MSQPLHRHPGNSSRPHRPGPLPFPARPGSRSTAPAPPPAPRRPARGRRLALVVVPLVLIAVVIATVVIATLVIAALMIGRRPEQVADTGAVPRPTSVFDLQSGDCYNTSLAPPPPGRTQPISSVEAVDCTARHADQVIAKITYSPAEAATGVPDTKADTDCSNAFRTTLVPAAFTDPTLAPGRLFPADAATWATEPVVVCVVFSDRLIARSLLR